MADSHTEVTSKGWFSRIGESIKGIVFGLIVIPGMVVLLWWNEGRAVTTANSLNEGASAVVEVAADKVDPANNKKLIHVTGEATAPGPVVDPDLGLSFPVLRVERFEEIYQWLEDSRSETKQKLGGGEETITTYTYKKDWTNRPVDSSEFKDSATHVNQGQLIVGKATITAENVTLGAFEVPTDFVRDLGGEVQQALISAELAHLPDPLKATAKLHKGAFLFADNPDAPQIGDSRITYKVVKPGTYSFVAAQIANTFEPYQAKAGDAIRLIESGTVSAELMFKNAQSANAMMTWIIRFMGFLIMAFGFMAVMRPLAVLGSVVPAIGNIIGLGTGLISFVLAATISLLVIAIAWIVVRPLLGIALLALVIGGFLFTKKLAAKSNASAAV
jgi:hypothetical protein